MRTSTLSAIPASVPDLAPPLSMSDAPAPDKCSPSPFLPPKSRRSPTPPVTLLQLGGSQLRSSATSSIPLMDPVHIVQLQTPPPAPTVPSNSEVALPVEQMVKAETPILDTLPSTIHPNLSESQGPPQTPVLDTLPATASTLPNVESNTLPQSNEVMTHNPMKPLVSDAPSVTATPLPDPPALPSNSPPDRVATSQAPQTGEPSVSVTLPPSQPAQTVLLIPTHLSTPLVPPHSPVTPPPPPPDTRPPPVRLTPKQYSWMPKRGPDVTSFAPLKVARKRKSAGS